MPEECAICFHETSDRVGPCGHTLCKPCMVRWFERSPTCPTCRQDSFGLMGAIACTPPPAATDSTRTIVVPLHEGLHFGVTLTDTSHGVRIHRVKHGDQCERYGIQQGTYLRAINGVPCTTHTFSVRLINAATFANADLCLVVQNAEARARKRRWWWRWTSWLTESEKVRRPGSPHPRRSSSDYTSGAPHPSHLPLGDP